MCKSKLENNKVYDEIGIKPDYLPEELSQTAALENEYNRGYGDGFRDAQKEATEEIRKNYSANT